MRTSRVAWRRTALRERVIGVAFDGAGWGSDCQIWGGEFLVCDYEGFKRCAHLRYVPLPGGDRQRVRVGAWPPLICTTPSDQISGASICRVGQRHPLRRGRSSTRLLQRPALRTSSCGRLFDAVSAICGISLESSYEGESAMLLEAAVEGGTDETYPFELEQETRSLDVRYAADAAGDCARNCGRAIGAAIVARCFHNSIAHMIESVCSGFAKGTAWTKFV